MKFKFTIWGWTGVWHIEGNCKYCKSHMQFNQDPTTRYNFVTRCSICAKPNYVHVKVRFRKHG